ncbi:Crp/Fnr family transcriptional regulator [Microvirga zambiensis]|uniref:Crp/Fnr family transcriptional regulator n=1 Tax=Microvirga zambiensis TaxID=1402137 RepID=UPI001FEB257B|nr:Crp/Fnr family transcriptional regulator [Microvirga zambiensis]
MYKGSSPDGIGREEIMVAPLIRKLENFTQLAEEEKAVLAKVASRTKSLGPRQDIVREGDKPDAIHLILEGLACRYKELPDGWRQIMAYFIPGDFCNLRVFIMTEMDHSVATLTPVILATIAHQDLLTLTSQYSRITQALWWSEMVDEAITREWLLNVGRRTATERMAHLIYEYFVRMRAVNLTVGNTCELPVTQEEISDTLGLSTVHVNRTLQDVRGMGLIELKGKRLTLLDPQGLQTLAMFSPTYLHFLHQPQDRTANDQARRSKLEQPVGLPMTPR